MKLTSMSVQIANNKQQQNDVFAIRKKVFVDEQNVPIEEEIDHLESESKHFILYNQNQPAGAGRFRIADGYGKIERICILKEFRGKGSGKVLMDGIESYAKQEGIQKLKLNAQTHAIPFYNKLGYEIVSEEFMDAGIPHKTMVKTI